MRAIRTRKGFTIIELLIVVIVIGILAAAGLAKYQNFAETSRRKTCLSQLQTLENAMAVWETNNSAFAADAKTAFGFTTRTGLLTTTTEPGSADSGSQAGTGSTLPTGPAAAAQTPAVSNSGGITSRQGPTAFFNSLNNGPLTSIIRDDKVWVCPSGLSRYYGGEIQNIPNNYMDISGKGVIDAHGSGGSSAAPIGVTGRYQAVVAGEGNPAIGVSGQMFNGGFPAGWIHAGTALTATNVDVGPPSPQIPFKIVMCGSYGTFGGGTGGNNGTTTSKPDTAALAGDVGGPVGPDGSTLNRHSARW